MSNKLKVSKCKKCKLLKVPLNSDVPFVKRCTCEIFSAPTPKSKERKIKAWAVARKTDNAIFDDGIDDKGELLTLYPVFKKKKDAIAYAKKTFNAEYPEFRRKFRYQEIAHIIPVTITY